MCFGLRYVRYTITVRFNLFKNDQYNCYFSILQLENVLVIQSVNWIDLDEHKNLIPIRLFPPQRTLFEKRYIPQRSGKAIDTQALELYKHLARRTVNHYCLFFSLAPVEFTLMNMTGTFRCLIKMNLLRQHMTKTLVSVLGTSVVHIHTQTFLIKVFIKCRILLLTVFFKRLQGTRK